MISLTLRTGQAAIDGVFGFCLIWKCKWLQKKRGWAIRRILKCVCWRKGFKTPKKTSPVSSEAEPDHTGDQSVRTGRGCCLSPERTEGSCGVYIGARAPHGRKCSQNFVGPRKSNSFCAALGPASGSWCLLPGVVRARAPRRVAGTKQDCPHSASSTCIPVPPRRTAQMPTAGPGLNHDVKSKRDEVVWANSAVSC
ncbi:hypothetical protein VTI74DRAFT_2176 [Chaetomium olivicolor]